ncbi:MAG TPA: hypothetical protein VGK57_01925, partial [Candidatus Binatia bacterium]
SVIDKFGSVSVGAARAREYVESQAVKTTKHRFMRITFLTARIISGTTGERQLLRRASGPPVSMVMKIIGKSFLAKCVDASRKNFFY